jgi:hypothetical protein
VSAVMKVTLLLLVAALLNGCSALRLAYDNADTYLRWRAGNYLDLHGEAADDLDERIDAFLGWHRAKALPEYARISEEAARRLGDGLSREDVIWGYDSVRVHAARSLTQAAQRIAPLLDKLSEEQVKHIESRFAEDNRKFARENLRGSEKDRRKRRADRVADRLEDWVGRLSEAQVQRVREFSERAPLAADMRDKDRKRLQGEFLSMVRDRAAQKRLPELAGEWDRGRDPAFVAANQAWREEMINLLLDIDRTLTPEQRARAQGNFRRYSEDFAVLSSRAAQ